MIDLDSFFWVQSIAEVQENHVAGQGTPDRDQTARDLDSMNPKK